ncbi:hypothetical protein ACNAUY_08210 [Acinetobacter tibetensis]|uniref:hypothetical protein n=1 Tax=Acinetobacter tibetensis TaxID=2943497 RepID=UPI003A4DE55D
MTTTVSQSRSETGKMTWANQSYAWSDYFVYSRKWSELGFFAYLCGVDEDVSVAEVLQKFTQQAQSETFAFAEAFGGVPGRAIFETLGFSDGDAVEKVFTAVQKETLMMAEVIAKSAMTAYQEAILLNEYYKNQYSLERQETLQVSEVREGLQIGQKHAETLSVNEALSNEMQFKFNSGFGIVESRFKNELRKNVESLIAFLDVRSTNFIFKIQELLNVVELSSNKPIKGFASAFGIDSFHSKGHNVVSLETLGISDAISRTLDFVRTIAEALNVADVAAKNVQRNVLEELKVLDAFLRTADAAIADMVLSTLAAGEDIDMEKFENLVTNGAQPGYTNWRDFIPGDYEYTKALFRVIIESSTSDRAQLQGLNVAVDVPDVNDRGTVTITNATAGGVVTYNRLYHVIPDVTLSARGGLSNPCVPEFLVVPNLTGFTVRLRDTITGSYVTGSFSWSAHGY